MMSNLFPKDRTNDFFEALFGDAEEGSYDISLAYAGDNGNTVNFELQLRQRPGCCLACNLTYGLPQVSPPSDHQHSGVAEKWAKQ